MSDVDPIDALDEALAVHASLRKLGFSADDIYLAPSKAPKGPGTLIQVVLRAQEREFVVTTGVMDLSTNDATAEWTRRIGLWNGREDDAHRQKIWDASHIKRHPVDLVTTLTAKGFRFRKNLN